jgi:peroxiredoxin
MNTVKTSPIDMMLRIALVTLSVGLLAVVGWAVYEKPQRVVVAGEKAPEFTITVDGGRTVSVPNFGGKVLLLNFWGSWCPPCVHETPSLSQLARDYASKGVVVLGISVDTDQKAYSKFLDKFKPNFLTVRDAKIHREYGTFVYPETYIIDSTGKVVRKYDDVPPDWSSPEVRSFIDSLL